MGAKPEARYDTQPKPVDASRESFSDGGSIPPASTIQKICCPTWSNEGRNLSNTKRFRPFLYLLALKTSHYHKNEEGKNEDDCQASPPSRTLVFGIPPLPFCWMSDQRLIQPLRRKPGYNCIPACLRGVIKERSSRYQAIPPLTPKCRTGSR